MNFFKLQMYIFNQVKSFMFDSVQTPSLRVNPKPYILVRKNNIG